MVRSSFLLLLVAASLLATGCGSSMPAPDRGLYWAYTEERLQ